MCAFEMVEMLLDADLCFGGIKKKETPSDGIRERDDLIIDLDSWDYQDAVEWCSFYQTGLFDNS